MAARRPSTGVKRRYEGSLEHLAGLSPTEDQQILFSDFNDHTETLDDHASHINEILTVEHDFIADFDLVLGGGELEQPEEPDATDFVAVFDGEYEEIGE